MTVDRLGRRRVGSVALGLAIALGLVLPSAAAAHRPTAYYGAHWQMHPAGSVTNGPLEFDGVLEWGFTPTYPEHFRPDAVAATEAWNAHATRVSFLKASDLAADPGAGACRLSDIHVVRSGTIDGPSGEDERRGGILAFASVCTFPGTEIAYSFSVTQDQEEPWHHGPPPVAATMFDLQGILTHEFGHATGWFRHFQESEGTECIRALRHTMCSTISPGTWDPRDLEPHDIDTWRDAY